MQRTSPEQISPESLLQELGGETEHILSESLHELRDEIEEFSPAELMELLVQAKNSLALDDTIRVHLNERTSQFDIQTTALNDVMAFLFSCFTESEKCKKKTLKLDDLRYHQERLSISDAVKQVGVPILASYLIKLQPFAAEIDREDLKQQIKAGRLKPIYNRLILSLFGKDDTTASAIIDELQKAGLVIFPESGVSVDDMHSSKLTVLYDVGLAAALSGRINVLATLIESVILHPTDKMYLQRTLPDILNSIYDKKFLRSPNKCGITVRHQHALQYLEVLADTLSQGRSMCEAQKVHLQQLYEAFSRSFSFIINTHQLRHLKSIKIERDERTGKTQTSEENKVKYIRIGDSCSLDLIPNRLTGEMRHHRFATSPPSDGEVSDFFSDYIKETFNFWRLPHSYEEAVNDEIDISFNQLQSALLSMVVGFIFDMFKKSKKNVSLLVANAPHLGALLRAAFPAEYLLALDLQLPPEQKKLFRDFYIKPCEGYLPYQISELPETKERLTFCYELQDTSLTATIRMPGFLVLDEKGKRHVMGEETLPEGKRSLPAKYFVNQENYYALLKENVSAKKSMNGWQIFLKGKVLTCTTGLPSGYTPVVQLETRNGCRMLSYPHQTKIDDDFFPIAVDTENGVRGAFIAFSSSNPIATTRPIQTPIIGTATCRFGGTLVGTVIKDGKSEVKILTNPDFVLDENEYLANVECTALLHPDEMLYLMIQDVLVPVYQQCANVADSYENTPVVVNFLSLSTNYIHYLLKHFFAGKMALRALVEGCRLIIERDKMMCAKMSEFADKNHFELNLTSSLVLLGIEHLYQHDAARFVGQLLGKLGISPAEFMGRKLSDPLVFENHYVECVINYLADINNHGDEAHHQVWHFIKENKDDILKKINKPGLQGLSVLDHIAQFAVLKLKYHRQEVLIALQIREQYLQSNYDKTLAAAFGPLYYLNWIEPILMNGRRLYFEDRDIDKLCALSKRAFSALTIMAAGHALGDARYVAIGLQHLRQLLTNALDQSPEIKLSELPHFWQRSRRAALAAAAHPRANIVKMYP